ncbi:MAG: S8 family peptidase [Bdellovibrionota bacterium]
MRKIWLVLFCVLVHVQSVTALGGANPPPPISRPKKGNPDSGTDPFLAKQWHLDRIGAKEVWKISMGDPSTTIAIVDSGINYNNPDIAPNLHFNDDEVADNQKDDDKNGFVDDILGWDFVRDAALPFDRSGHGTFMAGIIAAVADNGIGGAGVCPKCSLIPVRFLNFDGMGDTEDGIKGIYYAIKAKARIINMSFAGEGQDKDLERAIKVAGDHDILMVVSAGNDHENIDFSAIYPARYDMPNLITVAASTKDSDLNARSNWGQRHVHIAAPGDDIWSAWFDKWDYGDGTSDAAAVVSGAAGLIRSIAPALTAPQVKDILMATVRPAPLLAKKVISGGVLDVEAAVNCARQKNLPCLKK